jgi:hypothetical protein
VLSSLEQAAVSDWTSWFVGPVSGISANELAAVEAALGVEVPSPIAELWLQVERGRFKRRYMVAAEGRDVEVDDLIAVRPEVGPRKFPQFPNGFVEEYKHLVPESIPESLFPFARAPWSDAYALDTRDGSVKVYVLDTAWERVRPVADSFSAFMSALTDEEPPDPRRRRRST